MFTDEMVPDTVDSPAMGGTAPSGIFALELDLATTGPSCLSDTELVDAAIGLERLAGWVAARQAMVLAEFMARPTDPQEVLTVREWASCEISMALTLSRGAAAGRLDHAARLDGVLRPTRDLLEAGLIDPSRARLICDRTAVLGDEAKVAAVQARVLAKAPGQTWSGLASSLRRAILAVDPDGAAERHQKVKKERRVDVFPDEDGMATFWARMSAPDAVSAFEWLTRLARGMGAEDPRTLDQRRADLVAAALTGKLALRDPDADPDQLVRTSPVTPGKPLITVLVPHSTLIGADEEPCEIAGYGPIPAHLARDIAADAVWRRLLFDPLSGVQLDYGRETYRPPAGLADFVRGRDVVCRAPGCPRAAGNSELDHVQPWGGGGSHRRGELVHAVHHAPRLQGAAGLAGGAARGPAGRMDHPDRAPVLDPTPRLPHRLNGPGTPTRSSLERTHRSSTSLGPAARDTQTNIVSCAACSAGVSSESR